MGRFKASALGDVDTSVEQEAHHLQMTGATHRQQRYSRNHCRRHQVREGGPPWVVANTTKYLVFGETCA